jgi:hypothetical protein
VLAPLLCQQPHLALLEITLVLPWVRLLLLRAVAVVLDLVLEPAQQMVVLAAAAPVLQMAVLVYRAKDMMVVQLPVQVAVLEVAVLAA